MNQNNLVKILGLLLLAILIAALFLWGDYFLPLRRTLKPEIFLRTQLDKLESENTALRVDLERFFSLKEKVPRVPPDILTAEVYSRYPFNNKNELIIAAGSDDGVKPMMAVTADGLLIGRITTVGTHQSLVRTIFDADQELSVKIGTQGANGLFKGGVTPAVALVTKAAQIKPGDGVFSANIDMPFGLPLGEVADIRDEPGEIWQTALLQIPYDLETVRVVSIIINY